jgi:protein involved in polysaccharide export with SLBB domain
MVFFRLFFLMKADSYRSAFALAAALLAVLPPYAQAAERAKSAETSARGPATVATASRGGGNRADYLLQPQDVLKIFVFQHEDLNKQMEAVRVSEEYSISLPLVNNVNLRGKTAREAELLIRDAYDRDFLVNPQVSVNVVKYSDRSVNVIGQVNKPDRVLFPQEKGLTIIEAIALAGGQTRLADLKKVKLTRKQPNGETEVQEIDVDALMKRGGRDAIQLQKDDVIFIPERII